MEELDRPASFYLGREYDLAAGRATSRSVLYDARHLTTHAVCLGMTGSGKTGLGAILLEEAALDGVPSLVIDPKGDMANLLLTFPDLRPEDFRPWINPDDAQRQNLEPDVYAAQMAERWRQGLAEWGQEPERIHRLEAAADFVVYTPGSSAGRRISVLDTLKAPRLSPEIETEVLRDQVAGVVAALLALVGLQADPVRSREHILLANIVEQAWRNGQNLDLAELIRRVQKPPFAQLGVFPIETFFPEAERMGLAMLLNGLIAAPTFADWVAGEPLEIDALLRSPSGKPQISILYIAHLSEAERQFFVTLLLEQVVAWLHTQSGTTSLRALLYMDELFGYLPPHPANPPTKKPLLTLLKQARAFGLGLVLTTQNPVDLDYKALANAGTWFIGKMQTERDKLRVLDGLEGAQVAGASRAELDRLISALTTRVFLLHNVHAGPPRVFHTRWALSYLRGPLTRSQIRELMRMPTPGLAAEPAAGPQLPVPSSPPVPAEPATDAPGQVPPQLPAAIRQVFLPADLSLEQAVARWTREHSWALNRDPKLEGRLIYSPALIGLASVRYAHTRSRQTFDQELTYLVPLGESGSFVNWFDGEAALDPDRLLTSPARGANFGPLPSEVGNAGRIKALERDFADHLYYHTSITLLYNPHLKLYSAPDETPKAFQRRCREAARVARDVEAQKIQTRYEAQLRQVKAKLRREERELEEDETEYDARKREEFFSGAETVLDLFTGRKMRRSISTASRKRRLTKQAKAEIKESEETIADLESQIRELEAGLKQELEDLTQRWAGLIDDVQEEQVRPRRTDVRINLFGLAWVPYWEVTLPGQPIPSRVPASEAAP